MQERTFSFRDPKGQDHTFPLSRLFKIQPIGRSNFHDSMEIWILNDDAVSPTDDPLDCCTVHEAVIFQVNLFNTLDIK